MPDLSVLSNDPQISMRTSLPCLLAAKALLLLEGKAL